MPDLTLCRSGGLRWLRKLLGPAASRLSAPSGRPAQHIVLGTSCSARAGPCHAPRVHHFFLSGFSGSIARKLRLYSSVKSRASFRFRLIPCVGRLIPSLRPLPEVCFPNSPPITGILLMPGTPLHRRPPSPLLSTRPP